MLFEFILPILPFLLFEFILPFIILEFDIFEFDEPLFVIFELDIFEFIEPLFVIFEFDIFDEFIELLLVVLVVFEFLPLETFVFESPPQAIIPKDAASKADIANPFLIWLIPLIISNYFLLCRQTSVLSFSNFQTKANLHNKVLIIEGRLFPSVCQHT